MRETLTEGLAIHFANTALGHVCREYPNKLAHSLAGPQDAQTPSALHPVFYGSYDWHSCVHGYWMLAYLLRRFPGFEPGQRVRRLFDEHLVPEKIAVECDYLNKPGARGFERPYGWGWLLKLAAELAQHPTARWSTSLAPLADVFRQRFFEFLPSATYPVRVGTHFNTAFGLRMAADYAAATNDNAMSALLLSTARRWYGDDADCPAWGEPSGDDFLSSALIEAECMRRILPKDEFVHWLERFLPRLAVKEPATLFQPAAVSDRTDGKTAHLDGLNLSRAWCLRGLAAVAVDVGVEGNARRLALEQAADQHLAAGLPHIASDYMGEHWLASFAVLALEADLPA